MKHTFGSIMILLVMVCTGLAEEAKPMSNPPNAALILRMEAKKDKYTLDLGGKSAAQFKSAIRTEEKRGGINFPPVPPVDVVLEIQNTSVNDVKVRFNEFDTALDLQGPGVVQVSLGVARTFPPRGCLLTIPAGKSHTMRVSLQYGSPNASHWIWWTEPGDHALTARLQLELSPAPKGAAKVVDGFGGVMLTSAPLKLKVVKK